MLVCNHVSFIDAVLLMAASPRPIRFIMDHRIFATPVLGTLFRWARPSPLRRSAKTPPPTSAPLPKRAACWTKANCCASFPKAASRATAAWVNSRAV
jgi:1-acyl-sn-glycerol-3-phosphate acyltransferase